MYINIYDLVLQYMCQSLTRNLINHTGILCWYLGISIVKKVNTDEDL